jgi:hypothetical protein
MTWNLYKTFSANNVVILTLKKLVSNMIIINAGFGWKKI